MLISIDYDDTFTADPELWGYFINKAQVLGHQVICVSARHDIESNHSEMRKALPGGIQIVCTSGKQKLDHIANEGVKIDIWIDDNPEAIVGLNSRLEAAYDECERLGELVKECREQRDNARNDAILAVQKEMAELRAKNTRLQQRIDEGWEW